MQKTAAASGLTQKEQERQRNPFHPAADSLDYGTLGHNSQPCFGSARTVSTGHGA